MVEPQELHFKQVPFRVIWLLPHSSQMSPVKPRSMAAWRALAAISSRGATDASRVIWTSRVPTSSTTRRTPSSVISGLLMDVLSKSSSVT